MRKGWDLWMGILDGKVTSWNISKSYSLAENALSSTTV
jgi:hypothetical protein